MTAAALKIEDEIRSLPTDDVLDLCDFIVTTMHERVDASGLDADYRLEIERRMAEIDSGTAVGEDAFDALRKM